MKKIIIFGVSVLFTLLLALPLQALTLSSLEGTWVNPNPANANIHYYNDVSIAYGNGSEDQIRWGYATISGDQSGLGFTGVVFAPSSFDIDEPFQIGQLRHFNEPVYPPVVSSVDLEIYLSFADPAINKTFTFTFNVDETPNTTGDDWKDRDFIYFPNSYPKETFELDGVLYTLQLLGFGDDPSNLVTHFESPENSINSTLLWGKITNPVPEPATIFLVCAGFLGFLGLKRKNKLR